MAEKKGQHGIYQWNQQEEYVSIKELAQGSCDGKTVRMEGMVHAVRDMGDVRFVILRKAEGLVQCVYEEKISRLCTWRTQG